MEGLRKELKHAEDTIKKLRPDVEKRSGAVRRAQEKLGGLVEKIEEQDDAVFNAFCQRIGVANIREYEDVQLRIAKEANDAMEAFSAQHARVKHQSV